MIDLKRIVSLYTMHSSSADPSGRGIQLGLVEPTRGWQGFVDKFIAPDIKLGITRFALWMPFGHEVAPRKQTVNGETFDTNLRFDQYQQATKAGLDWLTETFEDAIRPLTEAGCQVIAYMGTLPGAPEYERERWYRERWIDECLKPFRDANCDLAFDSAVACPPSHYVSTLFTLLRINYPGLTCYAESIPTPANPHWIERNIVATEGVYQQAINSTFRKYRVDPATIKGELIRLFDDIGSTNKQFTTYPDWYQAKIPAALADGHTVACYSKYLVKSGIL